MTAQDRLDPERVSEIIKMNADAFHELERALLEAQRAMTMLAAAVAAISRCFPEDEEAEWQHQNRIARPND